MPLTKVSFSVIQVANNVTSTTVGNTTSIPSFTFDQNGVITSASNTAISGAGITANTIANSAFQTGSVERYLLGANLDFGMRNRIINGAMAIDQRNAGASVTPTTGQYTLDRWLIFAQQSSKFSVQQNAGSVTPPTGFKNYLGATSLSAYSIVSGDYFTIGQPVEGFNVADLEFGTANAKTITVSFWVRSSLTGTFGAGITNSAYNRSYPFSYTINNANTWEFKTVTIPGDTSGTWLTNNGRGIELDFGIGVGSDNSGTAGSWQSGWKPSVTGATSIVGTNGATFYITGVQLEEGSQATSFEYRHYGTELALCQRYFEKVGFGDSNSRYPTSIAYAASSSEYVCSLVPFVVAKRTIPTIVDGTVNLSQATSSIDGPSIQGFRFCVTATSSGTYGGSYVTSGVTASAEL